ncbi:hypothetical protein CSA37_05925 [Candidatus Fermentibacteria bacterium]|nr:MAG: hypothetical protein CSA37_05925 [Candidatus Fermentibacteria bacterium]
MNCYIFPSEKTLSDTCICDSDTLTDLTVHLRECGIKRIFTSVNNSTADVEVLSFPQALRHLGNQWIEAYSGMLTRQNPFDLREKAMARGALKAVSLGCSGRPWRHTCVFTSADGLITGTESDPSPENAKTNLCFSGLIWRCCEWDNPERSRDFLNCSGFFLDGYWREIRDREDILTAYYHILTGELSPWPHLSLTEGCVVIRSAVPISATLKGVMWVGKSCSIGENCLLENCVILDGAQVGDGAKLRNCLILENATVPPGHEITDKYLTTLGEQNG